MTAEYLTTALPRHALVPRLGLRARYGSLAAWLPLSVMVLVPDAEHGWCAVRIGDGVHDVVIGEKR